MRPARFDGHDISEAWEMEEGERHCASAVAFMVAGACNAPKPPDLPFRYRLPVTRHIPRTLPFPGPTGGFEPPALGV